jgi:hypothetical protein
MSKKELSDPKGPAFVPTDVTIVRAAHGKPGNAGNGRYHVSYSREEVPVTRTDTVMCYRLVDPTPPEIVFTGMRTDATRGKLQFSPPSISQDGRVLIFIDTDWDGGAINITLDWVDAIRFAHDPQVGNVPQPT